MIRSQKLPTRPVYNPSANNGGNLLYHQQIPTNNANTNLPLATAASIGVSTVVSSNNSNVTTGSGDITSYIGKILTINQHQVLVEDILGQGGFAFVFLVRSLSHSQQRYALKRMYVNNERDLIVCQREIAILKEFKRHPNIVTYVDSNVQRISPLPTTNHPRRIDDIDDDGDDDDDDAIYEILLLTEYCSHGALVTRLQEQRSSGTFLNERKILRIFADICQAVSACHFHRPQSILHRDIKLENILIDIQQNFVLCDFGSAIMLSDEQQQYQSTQLTTAAIQQLEEEIQRYTTLAYRAPEMIDLYSRLPITLKADIWAMGCLLYKLMYGILPFGESILAIQNGIFIIPDDMAQVYSRELNLFVRYMLEIDLQKRPDIWQVSYVTYKLLGVDCPISNRFQSKIPDLHAISMPLTESESRYQRTLALSSAKSTSANVADESSSVGTAVNPRERPRGMIAPSGSLINFAQPSVPPTQRPPPAVAVPPPPPPPAAAPFRPSHQRSGSAAQLMFDDDFSQFPTHALSLTNISTTTTTPATPNANPSVTPATTERIVSRARPSPPATLSATSGRALQQQIFPPPLLPPPLPPPPATAVAATPLQLPAVRTAGIFQHRRSSSQTISPTQLTSHIQPPFQHASSVDPNVPSLSFDRRHSIGSPIKHYPQQQSQVLFIGEASDDDDGDDGDDDGLSSNLNKLKVYNHSTENVKSRESLILNEDDRLFAKKYSINSQLKSDDEPSSSSSSNDDHHARSRSTSPKHRKNKKKSQSSFVTPARSSHHHHHYPSTEEAEKNTSSPNNNNKNLVKRLFERCSIQQQQQQDEPTATSTPFKRKDSFGLANENPIAMGHDDQHNNNDDDDDDDDDNDENPDVGFDQLINEDSDDDGVGSADLPPPTINTSKSNVTSGLFTSSRLTEQQQYEHFEDSDDDNEETKPTTKVSSNPTTKLFNLFTTTTSTSNNFKSTSTMDNRRTTTTTEQQNNQTNTDNNNPFLDAPFHHPRRSPSNKHVSTSIQSTNPIPDTTDIKFDATSIVVGKRPSAFAPYHKQERNIGNNVVDTSTIYNFGGLKPKLPHSESYPPGVVSSTLASPSKDVFMNAPFNSKSANRQPPMATNKVTTTSPTSSQSTSSSNSQLIDLTAPPVRLSSDSAATNIAFQDQPHVDDKPPPPPQQQQQQFRPSPPRRAVGSAGLITGLVSRAGNITPSGDSKSIVNTTNDIYYFHTERGGDGHSSSEELTSSSSRKRHGSHRKKSSTSSKNHHPTTSSIEPQPQQHAYANLSFNDAIVDEFL